MNAAVAIVVRGRHVDLSTSFRDHVADKLERVDRFSVGLSRIDVEISKELNPRQSDRAFQVELTCVGRGPVIRAEACADDKYAALDLAYARLEERLRRAAERRHPKHRPAGTTPLGRFDALVAADPLVDGSLLVSRAVADATTAPDGPAEAAAVADKAGVVYEDGPVVVREKTHRSAPMRVPEALDALELVGHDFFLFQDATTGCPSVVYKRHGYAYGLLRLDARAEAAGADGPGAAAGSDGADGGVRAVSAVRDDRLPEVATVAG